MPELIALGVTAEVVVVVENQDPGVRPDLLAIKVSSGQSADTPADHDQVTRRDLADPLPQITEPWIGASFTPAPDRTATQQDLLALSDLLVDELQSADTVVIGMPIYNFTIPASLKAWIDLVCRPGRSFEYTDSGPRGLLGGKRVIIALAFALTLTLAFALPLTLTLALAFTLTFALSFAILCHVTSLWSEFAIRRQLKRASGKARVTAFTIFTVLSR